MNQHWIENFWNKIETKLSEVAPIVETPFPYTIDERGKYVPMTKQGQPDVHWWTNGFWGGMMWLAWKETKKGQI